MTKPLPQQKLLEKAVALHRAGRLSEAQSVYRDVMAIDPKNPDASNLLGLVTDNLGDSAGAISLFQKAVASKPHFPEAYFNLANSCLRLNQLSDAIAALRQAIRLRPDYAEAYLNLGVALHQASEMQEALKSFENYIARRPNDPRGYKNKGLCLFALNDDSGAIAAFERSTQLDPKDVASFVKLANTYARSGDHAKAVTTIRKACALEPGNGEHFSNLGTWLARVGSYDEAFEAHREACRLDSSRPEFEYNYGSNLYSAGRYDEAVAHLTRAIQIRPDFVDAYINLAEAKLDFGAHGDSLELLEQATAIMAAAQESDLRKLAGPKMNRALVLLTLGRYLEGWVAYRSRFDHPNGRAIRRLFSYPALEDSSRGTERVLIWTEQGVGDEIMMLSMLPDAISYFRDCMVECSLRLVPLVKRSFPKVRVVPQLKQPHAEIEQFQPDAHTSIIDLGILFRRDQAAFPRHRGYLEADQGKRQTFRERYSRLAGSRPIVGIAWKSGAPDTGKFKSIPVNEFSSIVDTESAWFVSLQYGDVKDDIKSLGSHRASRIFLDNCVDSLMDLDTFASQVAAVDLVISVSNTAVHFAGALNVPVWTLVPKGPGAIWYFRVGETTPWYPSARLFRQDSAGIWADTIDNVKAALETWCQNRDTA